MPRKFVTSREIDFIEAITRELHQHVVDEEALYYAVLLDQTAMNDLYGEAVKKVWAAPVRVTGRFLFDNQQTKSGLMGSDSVYVSEAYFHAQELEERNVRAREGDFIEHGQIYYEVASVTRPQRIFGQAQNKLMVKCTLVPARQGQFQGGNDGALGIDRSHPRANSLPHPRQNPDATLPSHLSGSTAPAYPPDGV